MKNALILFLSIVTFTASAQAGHATGKQKSKHLTHKTAKQVVLKKKMAKAKLAKHKVDAKKDKLAAHKLHSKKLKNGKALQAKRAGIHTGRMPASAHGKVKKTLGAAKHKKKIHSHE